MNVQALSIVIIIKLLIDTSIHMDDIYENIAEYNPNKGHNRLIVFDKMADMLGNKKLQQRVTELFIGGRKLNIKFIIR